MAGEWHNFREFLEWKKSIKEKMKAVTNPLQFFLLLHNKRERVLELLQLSSLLSYLALKEAKGAETEERRNTLYSD